MGNINSRKGDKQVNLPHAWDHYKGAHKEDCNLHNSRTSTDKLCNLEGNKFTEFCERQAFQILNGRCGSDTSGKYISISQLGRSAVDYALVSEGLKGKLIDFRIRTTNQ